MKKYFVLLFLATAIHGYAQNYPVTGINITLPANPDPNTANWGTGTSIFMFTASTQAVNGRVLPNVMESKVLVTIKKGGGKACGDYTSNSAPASGFNTLTKVWGGTNAASLLGKGCILAPGDYEICVQFFGYGAAGAAPLSEEKCKPFSIKAKEQQSYQPPQPVSPSDGAKFSISALQRPLLFKWLPLMPKSQEPVTYRLKVWQLMEKQNGDQAMKANQPLINKDVENSTQTVITNLVSGPCQAPTLCDFVWTVQALNREGKSVGENSGTSKPSQFSANSCDVNLALKLNSVECLSTANGNNNYKICLSATYASPNYNLTYSSGNGFKAYPPSFSPLYTVSNITPALQVQSSGAESTVNYCINVSVPVGQTSLKIGLQGDDNDPGPMTCQPGAELDLRLPACATTCDCGNWVLLTVQNLTGLKKYECNSTIPWNCKVPFNFTDTYQCNPNNGSCQAKITWDVKASDEQVIKSGTGTGTLSDGFSLTSNGVYTLTLNAICNGIVCNSCVYKIVVSDCPPTCDCGSWGPILINKIEYKCGGKIEWKCNQTINFSDTYQCSPNDASCQAKTKWEITLDGLPYQSQGGASGSFTPTTNGVYTITLYANCNGKECPPCTHTFVVKDCTSACSCGIWGLLTVQNTAGAKRYDCGSTIAWNCKVPFNFTDTYQCNPNNGSCQTKTTWEVKASNGTLIKAGTGTGTLSDGFSLTSNGVYTLTFNATCNGIECKSCDYKVVVKDCIPACTCGKWIDSAVKIEAGGAVISRLKCDGTATLGKGTYSFVFPGFVCSPDNITCAVSYLWSVQGPVSGNGTGQTLSFNFSQAGTYTVTVTPLCDGKKCPPCRIVIKIEDPLPCSLNFTGKLQDKYCVGDQVTINWTGTSPPATVNLVLIDFTNWTVFQTIASGIPNSGSYTWTLPATLPCEPERKWCFYVTDPASTPQCWNYSSEFIIGCCHVIPCTCGVWNPLIVNGVKYNCGNEKPLIWDCKKQLKFECSYQCFPSDTCCDSKTKWKIENDGQLIIAGSGTNNISGVFTPSTDGTYVITMNAACSGEICKPCIFNIIVRGCHDACDCGAWGPILINKIEYKCGGKIEWKCNQTINFSDTYLCSPNDATCQAKTSWEIKMDDGSTQTGSGANGSFTPTTNGTYIITLNATCNEVVCKPCTFTLFVKDCPKCDCGKWTDSEVKIEKDGAIISRVKCEGPETALPKGTYNILFQDYLCDPNNSTCLVSYSWSVQGPVTGYGNGQAVNFNFSQAGTYLVTVTPTCGEKQCLPCRIIIKIDDPLCDCGGWGALNVHNTTGSVKYECGSKMLILWKCNQPFSFTSSFQCNPNTEKCKAIVAWEVKMADGSTQTGSGTSGSFVPTTNGLYSLILTATCNGIKCKPCVYSISVRDCPECDCGKWINSSVNIRTEGKTISRVKCGETAVISKGNYSFIFPGFVCNPNDDSCTLSYSWSVQGPLTGNGTGQIFSFNFSQSGTYTVMLIPLCGGKKCQPCKIEIKIEDPLPCSLSFSGKLKDKYCSGEPVTINWTGTSSPTTVNLVLVDFTNWTVYQSVASGIPNSGSYSWTLPLSLPCNPERKWCFYITDPASAPQCWNYSQEFTIGCCPVSSCNCGTWSPLASNGANYDCGSRINWNCKQPFSFTATYPCTPNGESCQAKTTWVVKRGGRLIKTGTGTNRLRDEFSLTEDGSYTLTLNASCNGIECKPCTYTIDVKDCNDKPCTCKENHREINQKITYKDGNSGHSQTVSCSGVLDTKVLAGSVIEYEIPSYGCGSGLCNVNYEWQIISVIKDEVVSFGAASSLANFTAPGVVGDYQVVVTAVCGTKPCGSCGFYFSTFKCIHIGDNYGGGVVFYVDNTCYHGLVAAPADQGAGLPSVSEYGTVSVADPITNVALGMGNSNTQMIKGLNNNLYFNSWFGSLYWLGGSNVENTNNASQYCLDLSLNGYDDWFLPSKNELNLLYLQRNLVGGFGNGEYWSSSLYWLTESDNPYRFAWFQKFDNGNQGYVDFHLIKKVRAIRGF